MKEYTVAWTKKNGEQVKGQIYTTENIAKLLANLEEWGATNIEIKSVEMLQDYYIFVREMDGNDSEVRQAVKPWAPIIIMAESNEKARETFLSDGGVPEDEAWRYYAVSVESTEKYICEECGKSFGWPDNIKESRGEYWGIPCSEDVAVCPHCGSGQFHETKIDESGNIHLFERG